MIVCSFKVTFGKVNAVSKQKYNALYCVANCHNLGHI